jgi:hypothetical protein
MTWRPYPLPPVPETTAAMVKAAFPKGTLYGPCTSSVRLNTRGLPSDCPKGKKA